MGQPGSQPSASRPVAGLAVAGLLFGAGLLGMFGGAAEAARLDLGLLWQVALGTILFGLPAAATLLFRPRLRPSVLGDLLPGRRTVLLSVMLGAALWVASIGLVELQALVRPPLPAELDLFRRLHAALAPHGPLDALVSLAVIAVLPAVCEELVMRGILLTALLSAATWLATSHLNVEERRGRTLAVSVSVVATAALFALIHDPVRLLFAFALGVALGALRLRTRSLVPPVLAHATLNTLTFVVAPLVDDPSQPYEPRPALGLACLLVGVALAWPLLRALRARPAVATAA